MLVIQNYWSYRRFLSVFLGVSLVKNTAKFSCTSCKFTALWSIGLRLRAIIRESVAQGLDPIIHFNQHATEGQLQILTELYLII